MEGLKMSNYYLRAYRELTELNGMRKLWDDDFGVRLLVNMGRFAYN